MTTKKEFDKGLQINFNSTTSYAQRTGEVPVLSADDFRAAVKKYSDATHIALLGSANTNWQNEIYKNSFSSDNNLSATGNIADIPFRVSGGYANQKGLLLNNGLERTTGALSLSPNFFKNHLTAQINFNASNTKNRFADPIAIYDALFFDPTQPVLSGNNKFGGYTEVFDNNGKPIFLNFVQNPVSLLNQEVSKNNTTRVIGNVQLDYKLHFFPDLHISMNWGKNHTSTVRADSKPESLASASYLKGFYKTYEQTLNNQSFNFYMNYAKEIPSLKSDIEIKAGTEKQNYSVLKNDSTIGTIQSTTLNYYGRLNYAFKNKYLLSATLRTGTFQNFNNYFYQRLKPLVQSTVFQSVSFAWKIGEEKFIKEKNLLSDLKLRVGYGVVGNQSGINLRSLWNSFSISGPECDTTLNREKTATYNAAIDFSNKNGRVSGTLEYYFKQGTNLISISDLPTTGRRIFSNAGSMTNQGIEFTLNTKPIISKNFSWNLSFNITSNKNNITNLTTMAYPKFVGNRTSPFDVVDAHRENFQINSVGSPVNTFYLTKNIYSDKGLPLQDRYVSDISSTYYNNLFNIGKSSEPAIFYGLTSKFNYKALSLSFSLHGNAGNYVFNETKRQSGSLIGTKWHDKDFDILQNIHPDAIRTGFQHPQDISDYYLEDASFIRMDNITLAYQLKPIFKMNLRLSASVQNAFIITKYSSIDPEIANGIDYSTYPRPRVFSFGVNATF